MSDYPNLTDQQSALLISIVELASELKSEPTFWSFTHSGGVTRISAQASAGKSGSIETSWTAATGALEYFDRVGFVQLSRSGHTPSFVLSRKGLDYPRWAALPTWRKRLIELKRDWTTDLRSGIIALLVALISAVVVSWLMN